MQIEKVFQACMKLPAPVLTVFLNTSESNPSRHPRMPTHLAWFLDNVQTLRSKLAHLDAKQFDRQANRVRRPATTFEGLARMASGRFRMETTYAAACFATTSDN
jgi:hypothetical protein